MKTERLERLSGRQLGALAMTAAEVPALRVCARLGWLWVLLGGLGAAAGLSALTVHRNRRVQQPMLRQRRAGRALWKTLMFALLVPAAAEAAASFPETARSPLAAALILLLAFWAARQGAEAAGRCAGILLWITGALCAVTYTESASEPATVSTNTPPKANWPSFPATETARCSSIFSAASSGVTTPQSLLKVFMLKGRL